MTRHDRLSQWTTDVSTNMPHLTKPQATVLALWSFGIACTRSAGRTTVATFLALLLQHKVANVEQRLYEWCLDAPAKAGARRTEVVVATCFAPLLAWIVRLWTGTQIALTVDASSLSDRLIVLAICVVYRGCAIPVAWTIVPVTTPRTWRRDWLRMLRLLRPAIPASWTVLVLADRGWYARWLFRRIVRLGWHPFLRIKQRSTFRPTGQAAFVRLTTLVGQIGQRWRGRGTAFATRGCQLDCTLVAWWGEGHAEPWFILTDLPPEASDAQWYGLRAWCEQAFKCTKRGGWQWQQTRMQEPTRVTRMWLAMAVATLWMLTIGSDLEGARVDQTALPDLTALLGARAPQARRPLRLFRLGWLGLLVQLITGADVPLPRRLVPEPWPDVPEQLILPSSGAEGIPMVFMPHQKALSYAHM
jgi:hypothetical protein